MTPRVCKRCFAEMAATSHAWGRECKNRHRRESYRFVMRGALKLRRGRPRIEDPYQGNPSRGALITRLRRERLREQSQ